jgi:lipopolysaccharide transport protein LptA/LPS export ABC transporter protein LptC
MSRGPRGLRLALAAGMLAMLGLVGANLRRPAPTSPTAAAPEGAPSAKPRMQGFEYRGYKADRESFVLRAERYEGQEQEELRLGGVQLDFTYLAKGREGKGHVRSKEGSYAPAQQRAVFRGDVRLQTEDGLELTTNTLIYRGDRGVARSDEHVEFRRGALSGSSDGMDYRAEDGFLELRSQAFLRIEGDAANPATEIRGGQAQVARGDDELRFSQGARVDRGRDSLTSQRLVLGFSWEEQRVHRVLAVEQVRLELAPGEALPGTAGATAPRGARQLESSRLELLLRPNRNLERALAVGAARLTILPAAHEPAEKRVLWADSLSFVFDEAGRLERVVGQKGGGFDALPLDPAAGSPRTVRCQSYNGQVVPETGAVRRIDFKRDVVFEQGTRRATAQSAVYEGESGVLALGERPRLADSSDGSELTARGIDLVTASGDMRARGGVRHQLPGGRSQRRGWLGGERGGSVTAKSFAYDAATRTASYREEALLRSGEDEVRAREIQIRDEAGGLRRLLASGEVRSVLRPQSERGQAAAPIEASAREMSYAEATQQVVYTGDVTLKQLDIQSVSPVATLTLSADGEALVNVVAGEPVEVRQGGARTAKGARLTYQPASQTMVLVGDDVVLRDAGREVHGKSLTFHLGDDRILVDGRDQDRIETVLPNEPPRPSEPPKPTEPPRPQEPPGP